MNLNSSYVFPVNPTDIEKVFHFEFKKNPDFILPLSVYHNFHRNLEDRVKLKTLLSYKFPLLFEHNISPHLSNIKGSKDLGTDK